MNAQTYINVSGQTIETPIDLPDRKFRDAWVLDGSGAVTLDPVKRAEIAKRLFHQAIEAHVEATAAERGYSSAASCAGYLNSTIPSWAAEATAFIAWRDSVWAHVFAQLALVEGGQRPEPTVSELVAELPPIVWIA
jgi:hypothetical protein